MFFFLLEAFGMNPATGIRTPPHILVVFTAVIKELTQQEFDPEFKQLDG